MDICRPRMPMHWLLLVRWQLEKYGKGAQWLQQLLAEQTPADEEYIDEDITEGSEAEDRNVEVEKRYHLRKRLKIKAPAHF